MVGFITYLNENRRKELPMMENNSKRYPSSHYQKIKVLLVEEDPFSREKLLRILERRFSNVLVAIDKDEGFQLYHKYRPDLVIADVKMDRLSGFELIKKIREQNDTVQIIATAVVEDHECILQAIEYNINHFIAKPIELDKLLTAIERSIHYIQIEMELDKYKKITRHLMECQDHLIFMIKKGQVVEWNHAFSSFMDIENNKFSSGKSLSSIFVEDPPYFYPKNMDNWLEEIMENDKEDRKVRWKASNGEDGIFILEITSFDDENIHLVTCTNITELETERKKYELIATLDPITSIYNRLKFDDILTNEIKRADQFGHLLSIIMFNIDDFKRINQQFGYSHGDEVLITLSTIVQQRIREKDVFARWSSEDFILLIPDDDKQGAAILAESIRSIIESFHFRNVGTLTCSFGITEFTHGKSKIQVLNEVVQALYMSKNNGKNCVTFYKETPINSNEEGGKGVKVLSS